MIPKVRSRNSLRTTRFKIVGLFVINIVILMAMFAYEERASYAPFLSASLFWLVLIWKVDAFQSEDLLAPRNYITGLFFTNMVLAPPLLFFLPERVSYLVLGQPEFWAYAVWTSFLWGIGFAAYAFSVGRKVQSENGTFRTSSIQAPLWMLIVGLVLIGLGIIGISVAAGSISDALALGGTRANAREVLIAGTYRYTMWMEAVPIGACLIWYYIVKNLRLGWVAGAATVILMYVPLIPFYIYSSGRAKTLAPLFLLIAVYHRYCRPVKLRLVVVGFVLLIPLLSIWDNYRRGWIREDSFDRKMIGTVVQGDLARYDISVVAIAGVHEAKIPLLFGETLAAAVLHSLPRSLGDNPFVGGTQAMGRAIFSDPNREDSSPFATPLIIEGYLNFGVLGVVMFMLVLGRIVRRLDGLYRSDDILNMLLALAIMLRLPFAVSIEISLSRIIWGAAFVWIVATLIRRILPGVVTKKRLQTSFVGR